MTRRFLLGLLALSLLTAVVPAASAKGSEANPGTIKIHDDATADPDERNEPHVSCGFWVEGFGMSSDSGILVFEVWPPAGKKIVVQPLGDTQEWEADAGDAPGSYHFLKGAYELPVGHYKVTSYDSEGNKQKSKVFWVDPCFDNPGECVTLGFEVAYYFSINGGEPQFTLEGVEAGDNVTVVFAASGSGEVSLVSYIMDSEHTLDAAVLYDAATGSFACELGELSIVVPPCYFEVDFVFGAPIEQFDEANGVTYYDEERLIETIQGGEACESLPPTPTTMPTPTTTEIPFFPTPGALALAVLGSAAVVGLIVLRRG